MLRKANHGRLGGSTLLLCLLACLLCMSVVTAAHVHPIQDLNDSHCPICVLTMQTVMVIVLCLFMLLMDVARRFEACEVVSVLVRDSLRRVYRVRPPPIG